MVSNTDSQTGIIGQDIIYNQGHICLWLVLIWRKKAGRVNLMKKFSNIVGLLHVTVQASMEVLVKRKICLHVLKDVWVQM